MSEQVSLRKLFVRALLQRRTWGWRAELRKASSTAPSHARSHGKNGGSAGQGLRFVVLFSAKVNARNVSGPLFRDEDRRSGIGATLPANGLSAN